MSRQCERPGLLLAAALVVLAAGNPAFAQETGERAEQMVERAKAAYGPLAPQRPKNCGSQDKNGEIVVCAPDDGKQWRVPSTSESDPNSRQATRTGVPRAPQLDRGSCKGKGQVGCIGLGGRAREIYMIDLKSIPETPKGSDAEKVANGEMADR
ncbi:MAG: hypothetical protein ACTHLU_00745 [Novosphingobium sp.]